jgi:hypothetical protein
MPRARIERAAKEFSSRSMDQDPQSLMLPLHHRGIVSINSRNYLE